jgi:hypothetical protein
LVIDKMKEKYDLSLIRWVVKQESRWIQQPNSLSHPRLWLPDWIAPDC